MTTYLQVLVAVNDTDGHLSAVLAPSYKTGTRATLAKVSEAIAGMNGSQPQCGALVLCTTSTGWAKASCYVECSSAPADGDTVTVAGVVFTYKTTPAAYSVDPLQVAIGASAAAAMVNLAEAVNAYYYLAQIVVAVKSAPAAQRVTFTATFPGAWANDVITLAEVSANITKSGAAATGGTQGVPASVGQGARLCIVGVTP